MVSPLYVRLSAPEFHARVYPPKTYRLTYHLILRTVQPNNRSLPRSPTPRLIPSKSTDFLLNHIFHVSLDTQPPSPLAGSGFYYFVEFVEFGFWVRAA